METIIIFINHFFDILWLPLSFTSPYVDIIVISAVSALIFLWIFKKTSNQAMIRHYKNRMVAHILEIRLYRDQPIQSFKSTLNIFWNNIIYLRYMLVPVLIILPPLLVISMQINNRCGYTPLQKGHSFLVRVDLDRNVINDIARTFEKVRYQSSGGVIVETPPLVIRSEASAFWRAKVTNTEEDEQYFKVSLNGTEPAVEKKIFTGTTDQQISPALTKWHIKNLFTDNAEGFISQKSPIEAIKVNYERAGYPFLFWDTDPIILYYIFTLLFGFLFKPILKVNI